MFSGNSHEVLVPPNFLTKFLIKFSHVSAKFGTISCTLGSSSVSPPTVKLVDTVAFISQVIGCTSEKIWQEWP